MNNKRCFSCMATIPDFTDTCPYCGYRGSSAGPEILPEGSIVGARYLVGCCLSRTPFVVRYTGLDCSSGRKVIIEELFPDGLVGRNPDGRVSAAGRAGQAFSSAIAAALDGAREVMSYGSGVQTAGVLAAFEDNGTSYTVYEWVDGDPLSSRIGRVHNLSEACSLLRPVIIALSDMHSAGRFHGAITADSIRITPWGEAVLIGTGSAERYLRLNSPARIASHTDGTTAPEAFDSHYGDIGSQTDIYSIGALVYMLVSGSVPVSAADRLAGAKLGRVKGLSGKERSALEKALELSIDSRQSNILMLYEQLLGSNDVPVSSVTSGSPKVGKIKRLISLLSGIVLVCAGAFLISLVGKGGTAAMASGKVVVPSLVNMDEAEARDSLDELGAGLKFIIGGKEYSDVVEAGRIMKQEPLAGTRVKSGSDIVVYISRGSPVEPEALERALMPDLTGESESYAREILAKIEDLFKIDIKITVKTEYSDEYMSGLIMSQSIAADEELKDGTEIILIVSEGPEPKDSPSDFGGTPHKPGPTSTPKPTEPPVQPTEPPVQPTEPPVQPSEPPVQPTEPPVQPTEPPVQPTEPPVQPTEPPVQPTEPPVQPTEPPVQPTDPPAPPPVNPPAPDDTGSGGEN